MMLEADHISYAYVPGHDILREVSLSVKTGEVVFVLGANGSGKTTLIECLCGIRQSRCGQVLIDGVSLDHLSLPDRARRIGVVPQIHEPVFNYTVSEVVLMGRAPHLGFFSRPARTDWAAVEWALQTVGIAELGNRPYTATSGGEQRLVLIARGLSQGASCLLMDEPDAHLDPRRQHRVLSTAVRLAREGFSFVVASHNPNNAFLYADWTIFLMENGVIVQGPPREVITATSLKDAYGMPFEILSNGTGARAVLPASETQ